MIYRVCLPCLFTLGEIDWQTDIREYVYKEFEQLFGEQKALHYVVSLEALLTHDLKMMI